MRRDAQAVVLLLAGAGLVKLGLTGTYARYVPAGALPLLMLAGSALVVLGGVTLWQELRREQARRTSRRTADDVAAPAQPAADRFSRMGWLLLLPVLVVLVISPPSLGSHSAARAGTAIAAWADDEFDPLPDGEPVRLTLRDYAARAAYDRASLAGRRVVLTGFVVPGPDGRPYLARLVVACCAADARPVKIGLAGDVPADLALGEWIEVEGSYAEGFDRDPINGGLIPYLQVAEFRGVAAPRQPYE